MANLSITIVTYQSDAKLLSRCLQSLSIAADFAIQTSQISDLDTTIIDNSNNQGIHDELRTIACDNWEWLLKKPIQIQACETNLGYGRAHNLAIIKTTSDYHLILNPDVILDKTSLSNALQFMNIYTNTALLTPYAINQSGKKEYLNKRYPDLLTLLIRGFAPEWLRKLFRKKISHYELRDRDPDKADFDIPLASGCFMLFRTPILKKLSGFSDKYFLYFEDYDLSIRTHYYGDIAYVPSVKIKHYGGDAAKKGLRHILLFIRSSVTFFNLHGWRLW